MGSAATERAVDTQAACFQEWNTSAIASDLKNKGLAIAERIVNVASLGFSRDALRTINFWYPNYNSNDPPSSRYYKRTVVGDVKRAKYAHEPCVYFDDDLNVDIVPTAPYAYLLTAGKAPGATNLTRLSGEDCSRHISNGFQELELEIDVRPDAKAVVLDAIRKARRLGAYGAWIYDKGHCNHPEIHPAEQMWWRSETDLTMGLFCDASKRFAYKVMMDGSASRPWARPPIKGIFAIAFEVPAPNKLEVQPGTYPTKVFDLGNITHYNVTDYLKTEKLWGDRAHNLYYNGTRIVSFLPHSNSIKVSFDKVGLSPAGAVRGFLVLETEVGSAVPRAGLGDIHTGAGATIPINLSAEQEIKGYTIVEGHYLFRLVEKSLERSPGVIIQ